MTDVLIISIFFVGVALGLLIGHNLWRMPHLKYPKYPESDHE